MQVFETSFEVAITSVSKASTIRAAAVASELARRAKESF
jgi:hypothetical protein